MKDDLWDVVVDASVGIKIVLAEPLSDCADALFARLTEDPPASIHVPDLFFTECANILWKYTRRFAYPPNDATQDLGDLRALPLGTASAQALLFDALDIAVSYEVSVYDACYVALAGHLGVPLVTADDRLADKMARSPYDVRKLSSISLPEPPARPATSP